MRAYFNTAQQQSTPISITPSDPLTSRPSAPTWTTPSATHVARMLQRRYPACFGGPMTGLPFRRYTYVLLMLYIISDSYTEGREGAQSVSLEIGPKYDRGPTSTEEFHKTELLNVKRNSDNDESGSPSKYSLHGSMYQPDPSSMWLVHIPRGKLVSGLLWTLVI